MDFGGAYMHLMDNRKVRRKGWPEGLWLEMSPGTPAEAAHPVIAYADGRDSHPYAHNNLDLYHSGDWVLADGGEEGSCGAVKLLERVLFLRMNGERPPGAPQDDPEAETWAPLDRDIVAFLQGTIAGEMR